MEAANSGDGGMLVSEIAGSAWRGSCTTSALAAVPGAIGWLNVSGRWSNVGRKGPAEMVISPGLHGVGQRWPVESVGTVPSCSTTPAP